MDFWLTNDNRITLKEIFAQNKPFSKTIKFIYEIRMSQYGCLSFEKFTIELCSTIVDRIKDTNEFICYILNINDL